MVTRCAVCVLIVLAGLVSGATKKFKGYNFESYAIGDNFGQYNVKDVLVIYYEFVRNTPKPSPFSDENDKVKFTPEMP
jgi:hypothetical protein